MSARGHRDRSTPSTGMEVGGIAQFRWAGVSDYTRGAASDPADTVCFDESIDAWLAAGFQGMHVATVAGLRNERRVARS